MTTEDSKEERTIPKFVRDIVLGVLAGIVIEATLQFFHFEILFPALPYIWLAIAGFLTVDGLKRSKTVEGYALRVYASLDTRQRMVSYLIVAILGAGVFALYWLGISKAFQARGSLNTSSSLSTSALASPIESLAGLGWEVKDSKEAVVTFGINAKPLPDVKESAGYFRLLRKSFRLQLQQVPSIAGLESLAGISECVEISISASDINDLSELHLLKSLRKLNISQTPLTSRSDLDISPLASLVNLETLGLNMSRVNNLEPLRGLTKLVSLNVGGSLVRDLSPIKGLTLLKSLDVRDSGVTDLSVLKGDSSLEELSVDAKQVTSLSHVPQIVKLTIIAQIPVDMEAVGNLSNLKSLFIWGPPVINLKPLRKLGKLTNLQVSGLGFATGRSQVVDADAIGGLAQLTNLTLGQVQIDSLRFLAGHKSLVELNLGGMPISSVSELANLASLKNISFADVPVVDISPLLSLPNLEKLYLLRTPARADVVAELQKRGVKVTNN